MRNFTGNPWNSTTGSHLYCVWITVHDDGGDRLVSIWMDPAMTAFQPQAQEQACGAATSGAPSSGNEEEIHKQQSLPIHE
jgi:uncharacterized protein GlcG (DUF336 family)